MTTIIDRAAQAEFFARLHNELPFFLTAIWNDRGLEKHHPLSEIEHDMVLYGAGLLVPSRRRGILAPRGAGKTHLVTAVLSAFRLRRDPDRKILIPSKSEGEAKKTLALIREWLDAVWFLQDLAPRKSQRDAATYFDVGTCKPARQESVKAMGIGGQLEGNRAHSIFPDDVETKSNTKTVEAREELARLTREFKNILYPHRAHANGGPIDPVEIVYVGTVKHEESIYPKLERRGYRFRTYPIAIPEPDQEFLGLSPIVEARMLQGVRDGASAPAGCRPNAPVFPARFPEEEILERRAEGETDFLMESMCVVNLASKRRYPLRLADLIVWAMPPTQGPTSISWGHRDPTNQSTALTDLESLGFGTDRCYGPIAFSPTFTPYARTIAFLDPAGTGSDEMALAIASSLNGAIFVHAVLGLPGGMSQLNLDTIASTLRSYNARELHYETNIDAFGVLRSALEAAVARHKIEPSNTPNDPFAGLGWSAAVIPARATGQKEARILRVLEPLFAHHRLVIHPDALRPHPTRPRDYELQHQLAALTHQRGCLNHDDRIDALAGVTARLTDLALSTPDPDALERKRLAKLAAVVFTEDHKQHQPAPRWSTSSRYNPPAYR